MSQLKIIFVGVAAAEAAIIHEELAARAMPVDAELPTAAATAAERVTLANGTNCLFIVDARTSPEAVRDTRKTFPGGMILTLADGAGTAASMLAITRAGADQVVCTPINRKEIGDAIDHFASHTKKSGREPLLVVVSGATTGCGGSTVAAALADELANGFQLSTILVEARLQMGVQAMNLDVHPTVTLADLVGAPEGPDSSQVRKALIPVSQNLRLLSAPQDLVHSGPNAVAGVLKSLEHCKTLASVVVADSPCHYDDLHFETLWAADQVVLVADQSIPGLRAARMMLDAMARAKSVKGVHVVLNRFDSSISAMSVKKISETLGVTGVRTIPNDYSNVMQAASEGRTLRSFAPDSPIIEAVHSLASAVLGQSSGTEAKSPGLFKRLFGS